VCVCVCVCVCVLRTTGSAVCGLFHTHKHSSELFHTFHVCMLCVLVDSARSSSPDLLKHRNRHTVQAILTRYICQRRQYFLFLCAC
jgi:hypothetical protein